jgi:hypothetical protein
MPEGMRAVPPEEESQDAKSDTQDAAQASGTGSATTEKRWEFGFFARNVTTTSSTPPDYDPGPGDK